MTFTVAHTWDGRPLPADARTFVDLTFGDGLRIGVDAPFAGDPPPPGRGSTPRLWEHEVVEIFVFGRDGRYTEIELGPHGHWLVLRLDGVRSVTDAGHAIPFEAVITADRWHGTAEIERRLLPEHPVRLNVFRIARRRHEAMVPVPGDGPDFHQPAVGVPWPLP